MMVFKLAMQAERHWRKLNSAQLLAPVIRGIAFTDGVMDKAARMEIDGICLFPAYTQHLTISRQNKEGK